MKTIRLDFLRINRLVILLLMTLIFALHTTVTAQQVRLVLKGIVQNQDGYPLPGITIALKGYNAIYTNKEGVFEVPKEVVFPLKAKFSGLGFHPLTLIIEESYLDSRSAFIVKMIPLAQRIEEILVTGRRNNSYLINSTELGGKFSGSLKDLPQSVSIVSKEFMTDKQAFAITDIVQDLAGVNQASVYDDMVIRGFNSGYLTGFRLINGMRSGYGYGTSFWRTPLTVNLESIEILKGPGASLFGDITPGGTINLVTKKPLEKKHTEVNFSVASFQTYRSTLDLGGAIDSLKRVLYRLNIGYENTRTFRDNNKQQSLLIAPSFTFRPKQGTQLDVDLTFDNFDGYLDRGLGIRNNDFYVQSRAFNVNQPTDFFKMNFLTMVMRLSQDLRENMSFHVQFMRTIYREKLNEFRTLNTYADAPDNNIMNMRFQSKQIIDYTNNIVSYLRYSLAGENVSHQLVLGADYAQYAGDSDNLLRESRSRMLNGEEVPLTIDLENPDKEIIEVSSYVWLPRAEFPFLNPYRSLGIYLQDQISIGDRMRLILGLRHEFYHSSSADLQESYQIRQQVWLPRAGLSFTINDQINYFASYSQGYVPVGADFIYNYENYGSDRPFKAEESFQVETGLKMGFFKNQLQMELSLFTISRKNMLISTGELSESGFSIYRQSGEVRSSGVEVDFRGQVTPEFQVMANYTFNVTEVVTSSLAGEEGQPLGNAPRNMSGLWLKYVLSKNVLKGLGVGVGVYYVDRRRMDNPVRQDDTGVNYWDSWPAYETVNAALYYHIERLRLSLNVNNIFDKYYYVGGFDYTRGFLGAPRNIMLSFGFSL